MSSYVIKNNQRNCRKHTGHSRATYYLIRAIYVNQNFKTIGAEKNLVY